MQRYITYLSWEDDGWRCPRGWYRAAPTESHSPDEAANKRFNKLADKSRYSGVLVHPETDPTNVLVFRTVERAEIVTVLERI